MWSCACCRRVERPVSRLPRLAVVCTLLALLGCGARTTNEGFSLIHVDDLATLLGAPGRAVTVLDANGADFRAKEGIIPGAVLLSNHKSYDVAAELPPQKDARLVFYCADSH